MKPAPHVGSRTMPHEVPEAPREAGAGGISGGRVDEDLTNHELHLIAEASDRRALSRGMQGLTIRVARAVNRQLGRSGSVFAERYHARALRTPRAVHLSLRYVLLNARKHELREHAVPAGFIDECSSAPWFDGFVRPRELGFGGRASRAAFGLSRARSLTAPVVAAGTWLLRVGHRRAGPMDVDDAPPR